MAWSPPPLSPRSFRLVFLISHRWDLLFDSSMRPFFSECPQHYVRVSLGDYLFWNIFKFNNCLDLNTTPGSCSCIYKMVALLGHAVRYLEV